MKVIGVIPARYGSTRLKGKVLINIFGKPLIQHVWEKAKQAKMIDEVIIATDSEKVKGVCQGFGARVVLTSKDCQSGSDRIAEAVKDIQAAIIVNIQGDEPLMDPGAMDDLVKCLIKESRASVATVIKRLENRREVDNPNVVKVVICKDHYALYFSRSRIPFNRDGEKFTKLLYYKHLGIYAYRKSFLIGFNKLPASRLEGIEKLEQLRILESGYAIKTVITDKDSIGVDTAEDLKRVKAILKKGV
ncbi:MAG: 3-deoxy-manno-octulosonate cytidylyltransferase [Candidatus Aceula meridiana]|nr:3-deoxy-manno-octulosonate cytidylyltransferase [Candidatus Aceula meridiana]